MTRRSMLEAALAATALAASPRMADAAQPVFDPAGKRVGTFNSVWRREADGPWRIVFDIGCPPNQCP